MHRITRNQSFSFQEKLEERKTHFNEGMCKSTPDWILRKLMFLLSQSCHSLMFSVNFSLISPRLVRNIMSEFAYPFGLMDPRSPEREITTVDASFVVFFS